MAITARAPKFAASASANSLTVDKPTGLSVGDYIVLALYWKGEDYTITLTPPAGFVEIQSAYGTTNVHGIRAWGKLATAGDVAASDFTVGLSLTLACHLVAAAWGGVDQTSPLDHWRAYSNTTATTSPTGQGYSNFNHFGFRGGILFGDAATTFTAITASGYGDPTITAQHNTGGTTTACVWDYGEGPVLSTSYPPYFSSPTLTASDAIKYAAFTFSLKAAAVPYVNFVLRPTLPGGTTYNYGYIESRNAAYATARAGGTLSAVKNSNATYGVKHGQQWNGSTYFYCYEGFFELDTSPTGGDTIAEIRAMLAYSNITKAGSTFRTEVRVYDWGGGTVSTADWVAGDSLSALPLVAYSDAPKYAGTLSSRVPFFFDKAVLAANLNPTGMTRFIVVSDRQVAGTQPSGTEYASIEDTVGTVIAYANHTSGTDRPVALVGQASCPGGGGAVDPRGSLKIGDLMIAVFGAASPNAPSLPEGWTLGGSASTLGSTAYWAWKVCDSDAELYSANLGTFGPYDDVYSATVFPVINAVSPYIGSKETLLSENCGETYIPLPSITPSNSNSLLLLVGVGDFTKWGIIANYIRLSTVSVANNNPMWVAALGAYGGSPDPALFAVWAHYGRTSATGVGRMGAVAEAGTVWGYTIEISGKPSAEWGTISISINDDAEVARYLDVDLTLSAVVTVDAETGAPDKMCFSDDGVTYGAWVDYATSYEYTLPDEGAGNYTVYVKFGVLDGETIVSESEVVSDTIEYNPYNWMGTLSINSGAASTDTNLVSLSINIVCEEDESPTHMAFSDDGVVWGSWEAFSTTAPYVLAGQTSYPTETRTVYCKVKRETTESEIFSDSIDLEVEWLSSVVINNGDATTKSKTVRVDITVENTASDEFLVALYEEPPGTPVPYEENQPAEAPDHMSVAYTVAAYGTRTIAALFADEYDNLWGDDDAITVMEPSRGRKGVLRDHSVIKRTPRRGVLRVAPRVKRK